MSSSFKVSFSNAVYNGCTNNKYRRDYNNLFPCSLRKCSPKIIRSTIRCQKNELAHGDATATSTISPALLPEESPDDHQIGIVNFLRGKNYFITGATGFLAKVLIEKILRTVPDVGKIFLMIKAKDKEAALNRLKAEVIDSELFKCIQEKHGKSYSDFMMSKLIPVVGDLSKPNLGMDANDSAAVDDVVKQIDVIVNSAGNTTFDERYDVALNTNVRGPARLMAFAKKCKKLRVFLHVSTAYVNGEREGIVMEKPFCMGHSIAGEMQDFISGDQSPCPALDLELEMKLASELLESADDKIEVTRKMKQLGLQRARIFGWQDTYVFTKGMGEMVINSMRGEIPVVIIRPSVIESTYREPFPGWIQGNRMLDPMILSYGKGLLPGWTADPKAVIDVIPADMVVNATIAAMAKHGIAAKPELNVYHVGSSVVNPLDLHGLFKFSGDHFTSSPLMDSKGNGIPISEMEFFSSMDKFSAYISNEIARKSWLEEETNADPNVQRRVEKKSKMKAEHLIYLAKVYEPYMFYKGWFDNGNTQKLIQEMSIEETCNFGCDVRIVNWQHYLVNIHIPGAKRHILMMKERAI